MFQVVLSASAVLSQEDLKRFGLGVCPQWDTECDHLLQSTVSRLADRNEPQNHVVLILDKVGFVPSINYNSLCHVLGLGQSTTVSFFFFF